MQWLDKIQSLLPKKPIQKEYFLALILKEKMIKAVVWEETEGEAGVVDTGTVFADDLLEKLDDETLLKLADQAIGLAEKTLPTNIKTTKTIFGLPDWWIEGNAIDAVHLAKIKKLSSELELKPLGFVVIAEAIAHLLKIEEGAPPTVFLISLGSHMLGVTLVRSGRIEASKSQAKSGKSDSEVAAGIIKTFGDIEILPSRMLLFDGGVSLEEAKQEFISYPWAKELSFLHFPKIDTLDEDFDAKAVVSGAAKELGFSFEEEEKRAQAPEPKEEEVAQEKSPQEAEEENTFGFLSNRDVAEELVRPDALSPQLAEEMEKEDAPPRIPTVSLLETIGNRLNTLRLPRIHVTFSFPLRGGFWLPTGIVAVLLALLVGAYVFIPTATIKLSAQTRTLENDVAIIASVENTTIDKEGGIMPAIPVEASVEGEKSQKATGKKTVGERANGEVIVYNKTENRKTFPKGTTILGPNNLRFTLDEEVTVASTAAFELTPSSVKAKVTAGQIGEESNVSANTNFPFKDFPTASYFAKNDGPFTGGTKREAVVVSKEDQEALFASLSEELRNRARDELRGDLQQRQLVDVAMTETISTKTFSKDVDSEAEEVSLKLAITFHALSYKEGDLLDLVESQITERTPQGFMFEKDTFETKVESATKGRGGTTSLTIHYKAALLPNLPIEDIKRTIVGKSKRAVEGYLQNLPLETFTIEQMIMLPAPFDLLPLRSENITIEVKK